MASEIPRESLPSTWNNALRSSTAEYTWDESTNARTVTATSAEGVTATVALDDWSRPIGSQQAGLADTPLTTIAAC